MLPATTWDVCFLIFCVVVVVLLFLCLFGAAVLINHSLATPNGLDGSGAIPEQRPSLDKRAEWTR